jgi:hypothetical protein
MSRWLPLLLFLLAVSLRVVWVLVLGKPWPSGPRADENVYLELAQNLWLTGTYGTRVSVTYPALYPMLIAPLFAMADNARRFYVIYALHGVGLGVASLSLWPLLRDHLGRARAWYTLAAAQLLAGTTIHAFHAQSESLFAVLFTAAVGVAYLAWKRPSAVRWVALGLLCGLAVSTRRMALVLPLTLGLLLLHDLVAAVREGTRLPWRRAVALAIGFGFGLLPEVAGAALHGEMLQPYGESSALSHLKAGGGALRLAVTAQTAGRHIAYLCAVTLGMPLILALVALDPGLRRPEARPLARTVGFVGYAALGMVGLTSLHIVRYTFKVGFDRAWHLYPRYVDPLDLAVVAVGVAGAAWLLTHGRFSGADARQRLLALVPWSIVAVGLTLAAGPLLRSRGGRLPSMKILQGIGLGPVAPWVFAAFCLLVIGLALWWWRSGRTATVTTVVLASLLSWTVSTHSVYSRALAPSKRDPTPAILRTPPLEQDPRAPVAVMVGEVGAYSRKYYEPAFRSDHPVWFIAPGEAVSWVDEHPGGLVLVLQGDVAPPLRRVARAGGWRAYAPLAQEEP